MYNSIFKPLIELLQRPYRKRGLHHSVRRKRGLHRSVQRKRALHDSVRRKSKV